MALKPYYPPSKPAKPSRLLAVIALSIVILLPYFLVKTFRHEQKKAYSNNTLSLPGTEQPSAPKQQEQAAEETLTDPANTSQLTEKLSVAQKSLPQESNWEFITTREGDSLASVFKRLGLSGKTLQTILHDNPHAKALSGIKPNQQLQVLRQGLVLEKMIVPVTTTQFLVVSREGEHYRTQINARKMTSHTHYVTATVHGSLYATAKRMNISYKLIREMVEIFNWEIDFARDVRAGDQFTIIYKALFIENKQVGVGDITSVTYTNRGKVHQAIRHTHQNGDYDYYTPEGNSLRKAFTRYPIKFSHISSTFSLSRQHPVLHYKRPHKGIDLAAPIGTPVRATGDGQIEIIAPQSGYGNMIKIVHNKTYSSIYAHMLKFQKGLTKGDHIKRGQVIGYVGQTGLATGPHCHYEFHINHQPKNPTTVDLPRASPVPAREMASFKANSAIMLAQMKLYEEAKLAAAEKKSVKKA